MKKEGRKKIKAKKKTIMEKKMNDRLWKRL